MIEMRYDIDSNKRDPRDMILWNTADYYGLTYHDEMLGNGVPSFHIQDTAVAMNHFNGAVNPWGRKRSCLSTSRTANGPFANPCKRRKSVSNWMHIGFVLVDGRKCQSPTRTQFI